MQHTLIRFIVRLQTISINILVHNRDVYQRAYTMAQDMYIMRYLSLWGVTEKSMPLMLNFVN